MARVSRATFDGLPTLYSTPATPFDFSQLQVGDILIHNDSHTWNAYNESGRLSSFHCSMFTDAAGFRCHATPGGGGVTKDSVVGMGDMCLVFRLAPAYLDVFAPVAAGVAEGMVGVAYSRGRAIGSALGSKTFGKNARARLTKYATAGYANRPKHVICSELVILAYQIALGETSPAFINLDAKHSTPGDMESYFLGKPTIWELAGRVRGTKVT